MAGGTNRQGVARLPDANQHRCKLVVLGETSVGKTCIVLKFAKGEFSNNQEPTIGASYYAVNVDATIKLEIWDTAGQERFHSIVPMYIRGSKAAIVVYDITNNESFVKAQKWVKELRMKAEPNIVIALAGNKVDLKEERKVSFEDALTFAEENNLIFMETSALTSMNIKEIFAEIANKLRAPLKPDCDSSQFSLLLGDADKKSKRTHTCCNKS